MLTKTDFDEIRKIIREEGESESETIRDEIGGNLQIVRMRIQKDIDELQGRIKNIDIKVAKYDRKIDTISQDIDILKKGLSAMDVGIKTLTTDMKMVKKNIKILIDFFDKQETKLSKRVEKTENQLGISY